LVALGPVMTSQSHILLRALLTAENLALAGVILCVSLLVVLLVRAMWRLRDGRHRSLFDLIREQRGTATIEFVLVFPMAFFFSLLLAQMTLLMVGNLFVHYAAFAATRSAITIIPESYADEPRNVYIQEAGQAKHDLIRSAAAYALVPVGGRSSADVPLADAFEQAVAAHFDAYGEPTPRWVTSLAADRVRYTSQYTTVRLLWYDGTIDGTPVFNELRDGEEYAFGPKEPITVRVTHQLNLSVPYVRIIFSDGRHAETNSAWTQITAMYTLSNEGIVSTLPPEPTLPRNP